jgi:hypothetical protein
LPDDLINGFVDGIPWVPIHLFCHTEILLEATVELVETWYHNCTEEAIAEVISKFQFPLLLDFTGEVQPTKFIFLESASLCRLSVPGNSIA